MDIKKDLPKTEIGDSILGPQVLSLGNFLGQRCWGSVWNVSGKKYGSCGICTPHSPPLPLPHSFHSASLGAGTLSLTNPTGRGRDAQEFLWERKLSYRLCCLLFSLPAPPWTSFVEISCSQESSGIQTLGEPNPTRERGQGATNGPNPKPESCGLDFLRFSYVQPGCVKMSRLWADECGFQLSSLGGNIFGLSNSRLPCR